MERRKIKEYYNREEVVQSLLKASKNREVSATLSSGGYTSRPSLVQYPNDIKELVKKGAVSFHGSVERWSNPMELGTKLREEDFNRLRKGWDLVLDIDSELELEAGKLALKRIIEFLESYGIKNYGMKFSGRRGFHISIPWKAFPKKIGWESTSNKFPEIGQTIAGYIREEIKDRLLEDLMEMKGSYHQLSKEIEGYQTQMSPYDFVDVEKDWGRRHLFRLPYSLHEKTWLVSYPLEKEEIDSFEMRDAKPENVETGRPFFREVGKNIAKNLLEDAVNWMSRKKSRKDEKEEEKEKKKIKPKNPVSEEKFPPCIKLILKGLSDGRKRSVFILITFLRTMKWDWNKIKEKMEEWNQQNDPPLPKNYIKTQLKWFKRQDRELVSPSCDNKLYYKSIGVCNPDEICKQGTDEIQIKNPVVYPFKKKN